jgi:hypothetical protein
MEVVRSFSDQLGMLPLPLHPLLEESASDASQAMKDMHRERITLDVSLSLFRAFEPTNHQSSQYHICAYIR